MSKSAAKMLEVVLVLDLAVSGLHKSGDKLPKTHMWHISFVQNRYNEP